jgi:hypothetical protein
MLHSVEFQAFPKIARLNRECVITEKIDGTNASIFIGENGEFLTGSRTRWITPQDDNYGFAKWAAANKDDLLQLGVGHHFGEWWGQGIQRNYARTKKTFSLFNTERWTDATVRPECCEVVPVLYAGPIAEFGVMKGLKTALSTLERQGSFAAPGFMKPEGVIVWHTAARMLFKVTLDKDDAPKALAAKPSTLAEA